MNVRRHIWALALFLVLASACKNSSADSKPSVKILSPPDQHTIVLGDSIQITSRVSDDNGINRVELRINDMQIHTVIAPENEKSFRTRQTWIPPDAGSHLITVIAYDNKEQASEPVSITISVEPAPTPTDQPPVGGTPTSTASACTYDATFVTDVTIPDDTELAPNTEFVKTWRLRNSGTCDWGKGFQFVFIQGDQMGGPAAVSVSPTPAGDTVDISVPLRAPQTSGSYRGRWRMRTPDGQTFGDHPFVRIVVPLPPTATPLLTPTATALPKPDLDITLIAGELDLLVGQTLRLRVTVRNHGPGATDQPALIRTVLHTDLILESSVGTLPAGSQAETVLQHTFDAPADLEAFISVDPDDHIAEVNENNNTEKIPILVNPPLYTSGTFTATPGLSLDLDQGITATEKLDLAWQVVEGTVYLQLLNGAGATPLSGEASRISYALVAGLTWTDERLPLLDLSEEKLFGFRTSDGRVGYAQVETLLDAARTSARIQYWIWDWP